MQFDFAPGVVLPRRPALAPMPDVFRQMVVDLVGVRATPERRARGGRRQGGLAWQDRAAWLRALPHDVVERLARTVVTRRIQAGQPVLRRGDDAQGWIGVVEGFLVVEHLVRHGATASIGLPSGAWHGEQELLLATASESTVVASMPSLIAVLPAGCFQSLLEEQPAFSRLVLQIQAQRMAALRNRLAWPRRPGTDAAVALRIAELFCTELLFDGEYRASLTQSTLSRFLGLSRQRTNEALNRLRRLDELDLVYGGVRVKNPPRLIRRALDGELD